MKASMALKRAELLDYLDKQTLKVVPIVQPNGFAGGFVTVFVVYAGKIKIGGLWNTPKEAVKNAFEVIDDVRVSVNSPSL